MHRPAVARLTALFQPLANIIVSDDGRLLLEEFVPARVVSVVMRVDDEAHRLVGNALERRLNFVSERSVLIVNDHDAVIANGGANVASGAHQHVNIARDFRNFDLHFAEVLLLSQAEARREASEYRNARSSAHRSHP